MQYVYPLTYGKPSKLDHFPNTNAVCLPKAFPTKIAPHLSGRWRSSMSPVLLGEFAGQWWAVVGSGGQWWTFCTRRDLTLMVNKLFFFLVFPNIALLYSRVVNCYESLLLITHIYIYYTYDCRSKGPCRDFPLQRPPGFQHETPRKFFSEFAKVFFWGRKI